MGMCGQWCIEVRVPHFAFLIHYVYFSYCSVLRSPFVHCSFVLNILCFMMNDLRLTHDALRITPLIPFTTLFHFTSPPPFPFGFLQNPTLITAGFSFIPVHPYLTLGYILAHRFHHCCVLFTSPPSYICHVTFLIFRPCPGALLLCTTLGLFDRLRPVVYSVAHAPYSLVLVLLVLLVLVLLLSFTATTQQQNRRNLQVSVAMVNAPCLDRVACVTPAQRPMKVIVSQERRGSSQPVATLFQEALDREVSSCLSRNVQDRPLEMDITHDDTSTDSGDNVLESNESSCSSRSGSPHQAPSEAPRSILRKSLFNSDAQDKNCNSDALERMRSSSWTAVSPLSLPPGLSQYTEVNKMRGASDVVESQSVSAMARNHRGCQILIERWTSADWFEREAMLRDVFPFLTQHACHPSAHLLVATFLDAGLELNVDPESDSHVNIQCRRCAVLVSVSIWKHVFVNFVIPLNGRTSSVFMSC